MRVDLHHVPVQWLFDEFMYILTDDELVMERHKKIGKQLCGCCGPTNETWMKISLNSSHYINRNRDAELSTLVHELCHVVFGRKDESYIHMLGMILMWKFNKMQKEILKSFIPREETNKPA